MNFNDLKNLITFNKLAFGGANLDVITVIDTIKLCANANNLSVSEYMNDVVDEYINYMVSIKS